MVRFALIVGCVSALGCVRAASEPTHDDGLALAAPTSVPVAREPASTLDVQTVSEAQPNPPPSFSYPPDLTGQALPRVVAPTPSPQPTVERLGQSPTIRIPPRRVIEPDPNLNTRFTPSPVLLPRQARAVPTAPPEKVPLDIGNRADAVPAKPALPEAPGISQKGPNVNEPPKLPMLGRSQPDRAPLDDPTAELGNAAIAGTSKTPQLAPSPFAKFGVPDPFELAAQIKPRVPPSAEPGTQPIPVNPERKK